jgi:hypothetical protein
MCLRRRRAATGLLDSFLGIAINSLILCPSF